ASFARAMTIYELVKTTVGLKGMMNTASH
nr:hypothetical protein [Tanacetum cinerariifolium]